MGHYDLVDVYQAPDEAVAARMMAYARDDRAVRARTLKAFLEGACRGTTNRLAVDGKVVAGIRAAVQ